MLQPPKELASAESVIKKPAPRTVATKRSTQFSSKDESNVAGVHNVPKRSSSYCQLTDEPDTRIDPRL